MVWKINFLLGSLTFGGKMLVSGRAFLCCGLRLRSFEWCATRKPLDPSEIPIGWPFGSQNTCRIRVFLKQFFTFPPVWFSENGVYLSVSPIVTLPSKYPAMFHWTMMMGRKNGIDFSQNQALIQGVGLALVKFIQLEEINIPSLKLTTKAHENGWLEDGPFLLGYGLFSGA